MKLAQDRCDMLKARHLQHNSSRRILYIRYCNLRDWYLGRPYNNALQQSSFYLSNAWTTTATDPLVTYFVIVDKLPRWWNHDLQMFDTCIKRHVLIKDNTKSPRSHQQHIRTERMEKDNTLPWMSMASVLSWFSFNSFRSIQRHMAEMQFSTVF